MDDRDLQLIALVQQHQYIYDKNSNYYKHKIAVGTAWKIIAETMKTTEDDCQRRWCVLRNRYAKERRERGKNDLPKKPWPLMEMMSFLEAHVKQRRSYRTMSDAQDIMIEQPTSTNRLIISKPEKWEEIIIDEEEDEDDEHETKHILSEHSNASSFEELTIYKKTQLPKPQDMPPAPKLISNTTTENNHDVEMINSTEEKLTEKTISFNNNDDTNSSDDSIMHFCLSLHESLQKIPKKYLTKAKIEILQVLDKYENFK